MLVVFDLDFTLWDAGGTWCDHTSPPYSKENGYIRDADRRSIYLYPDVKSILDTLSRKEVAMAIASRTHSPDIARKLMNMFGIRSCFLYEEIYPGSKTQHFEALHRSTQIPYQDMYFFDDEYRNIVEVEALGVNACHVGAGLSWEELRMIPGKFL
jgi:magnesium-dependent phosphatase 1